jgi:hypothetical protein
MPSLRRSAEEDMRARVRAREVMFGGWTAAYLVAAGQLLGPGCSAPDEMPHTTLTLGDAGRDTGARVGSDAALLTVDLGSTGWGPLAPDGGGIGSDVDAGGADGGPADIGPWPRDAGALVTDADMGDESDAWGRDGSADDAGPSYSGDAGMGSLGDDASAAESDGGVTRHDGGPIGAACPSDYDPVVACRAGDTCRCGQGCPCEMSCTGGSHCIMDCIGVDTQCWIDGQGTAELETTCSAGATCSVSARGGADASMICELGATCTVDASGASATGVACGSGASCVIDGSGSSGMRLTCVDASCELSCDGATDCSAACDASSACVLHCDSSHGCGYSECDAPVDCGGGVTACNRACP